MDLAYSYDHIINNDDRAATPTPPNPAPSDTSDPTTPKPAPAQPARQNLQTEFQETFKAFSNSPWAAKLGGLWGNVRKQGESYYEEAVREAEAARIDAIKGLSDIREGIVGRVRSLSVNEKEALHDAQAQEKAEDPNDAAAAPLDSSSDDTRVQQDTETFLNRFRATAAQRLRDVQRAEDAADEALLRFGTTIRSFLRDAVSVSAPDDSQQQPGEIMFESKDASGKRTIHTSRMDAQLHAIHTSSEGFMRDPEGAGEQWEGFRKEWDVEKETDRIAGDLERYPELRRTMEGLVPEKVGYGEFWGRYYFLRRALEAQEERRRELLKATANDTEEVGWDEDSDDNDEGKASTPQIQPKKLVAQNTNDSSTTVNQSQSESTALKPEGRRSNDEKSVADSEASYDIVSGATSRAASSPKERKTEESDEDWE